MGIKKLFTFLNNNNLYKVYPYLNDLINELNIDKKKLLVGVDGNLFCYKYIHSYDNMLIGFFNQILKFKSNKIIPLYIFDGGTFQEKENTNFIRYQKKIISKQKLDQIQNLLDLNNDIDDKNNLLIQKKKFEKNSTKVNNNNISILLELLDLLNIPYIFSFGEGEYLAVLLNKYNIIDFFLTDDTDPIPAGINKTIKFYNNSVYYLETKLILEHFNFTSDQLCDFCILLGSDYAIFNHGLKPIEICNLINEYHNIENIYSNNKISNISENNFILINKIRNIYKNADYFERNMFIGVDEIDNSNINLIIDHNNIYHYSNIMLEHWDEFVNILKIKKKKDFSNDPEIKIKSDIFKSLINNYISSSKFNIKKIINFIRNNIQDITQDEISNIVISFEFLNTFGFL